MKRTLILVLAVLMLLLAPTMLLRAEAAEVVDSGTCGENLTWTLDSDGLLTISGTGGMTDYSSSSVTPWLSQRKSILSVVLEEGVTSIGDMAFIACTSLSNITIPDGVTSIGDSAFSGCTSLSSITLPAGITSIGSSAFYGCKVLRSITLPEGVTSIGGSAFEDCTSLSSITIPDSVTSIGKYAFENCTSLSSITIPDSVTTIGGSAFWECTNLSSITIPDSVTTISSSAFWKCTSLSNIALPEGVTSIGDSAFKNCDSLTTVHYAGTEAQKADISIGEDNKCLTDAIWHYECIGINCPETPPVEETEPTKPTEPEETKPTEPEETKPTEPEETKPTEPEETKPTEPEETKPTGPEETKPTEPVYDNPFVDVFREDYYYDPVLWAVKENITTGMDETHFAPAEICSRGQVVTFLWRASGSPEPQTGYNPFRDVKMTDYFYKAVLWAVENGITSGVSADSFDPGAACTRGQVATFLWRSQGKPYAYGENIFGDIAYGAYYYDAVLWAVDEGITNGVGEGLFAPDATCTRGQIVTFLYRAMK